MVLYLKLRETHLLDNPSSYENYDAFKWLYNYCDYLVTLKRLGGGGDPPDVSRDTSATRVDLAAPFHDIFSHIF